MVVSKKTIGNILIILPCIIPPGIYQIPSFSTLARLKYLSFLLIVILYRNDIKLKRDNLFKSILFFCSLLFILTISRTANVMACISTIIDIITPALWVYHVFAQKTNRTIKGFQTYLWLVLVINFILTLVMPNGIYHPVSMNNGVYLLGDKNKVIEYLLPALAIIQYENERIKNRSLFKWIIYIICIISIWRINSITSLLVLLLYMALREISENHAAIKKVFSIRLMIPVLIVITVMILTGYLSQTWIMRELSDATGRAINFSGRATLWEQAIALIKESPIIGYGITENTNRQFVFYTSSGIIEGFSTHDGYLRLLIEGGLVELLSYIFIIVVLANKVNKVRKISNSVNGLSLCIICLLIVFIMEAEYYSSLFIMTIVFAWKKSQLVLLE